MTHAAHRPVHPRTLTLTREMIEYTTDLRLREALAPRVLLHAPLLPPDEKALLESVFCYHTPVTLIAHAAESRPREVRRLRHRVRRLVARVLSSKFRCVARAVMCRRLSANHAAVARRRFLHARTLRQTARDLGLPLHVVRRLSLEVEVLTGMHPVPLAA